MLTTPVFASWSVIQLMKSIGQDRTYVEVAREGLLEPLALAANDQLVTLPFPALALNLNISQPAALQETVKELGQHKTIS